MYAVFFKETYVCCSPACMLTWLGIAQKQKRLHLFHLTPARNTLMHTVVHFSEPHFSVFAVIHTCNHKQSIARVPQRTRR